MRIPEHESVLHSWCVQSQWHGPTIVGGSGATFRDDQGRTYLDMSSLAECVNLGHQHPKVVAAIREQAERLCYVTAAWGAEPRARLAQRILELGGFTGGRVYFTLGGADANEHAVKFARQASGLPQGTIITRSRSYHGASYAAGALSGDYRTASQMDPAAFHVVHCQPPYAYRCPYGSRSPEACGRMGVAEVEGLIRADARGVAAVLMEADAGTNGIVAPDNYWPLLREATRRAGVLLAADEVMSGFGRCGEWFAWQRHGEAGRPDLMTLAKGLTGGHLPLAAVVLSREVAARLEDQMLYTGLTYCGHPLCCAAGLAAIAAYEEEDLIRRSRTLGAYMLRELQAMAERHPAIGDVRGGHGLFAVVELVKDRETREPLAPWGTDAPGLRALVDRARARGVSFAARGNLLFLAPPLVITGEELDEGLGLLDSLLTELEAPVRFMTLKDLIATHVRDGQTLAMEGFTHLIPYAAGHEIIRQGRRGLHLVRMTPDLIFDQMIGAGCARALTFSWGGNPGVGSLHRLRDAVENGWPGPLELHEHSHAGMAAAYTAGAARLPFGMLRGYDHTDLAAANPQVRRVVCPYTGEALATVPALNPDVTVLHAQKADRRGNILLVGIIGAQKEAALAAGTLLVTVEELVDELDAPMNAVVIPGFAVAAVAHVPGGAHPSYAHGYYARDNAFCRAWDEIARKREPFLRWIDLHVRGTRDHAQFLRSLDPEGPHAG